MDEQEWIDKMVGQLKDNLKVGNPLGYRWFREKKYENKRLFYFVNFETNKALLVAYGTKKDQRGIINHCLENREKYFDFLK